jgi:hypothetical protein
METTQHSPLRPRSLRLFWTASLLLVCGAASGCLTEVPFHQRRAFADATMDLANDPLEVHWYSKVHYSMEGSIGGFGGSGGGGCGCY